MNSLDVKKPFCLITTTPHRWATVYMYVSLLSIICDWQDHRLHKISHTLLLTRIMKVAHLGYVHLEFLFIHLAVNKLITVNTQSIFLEYLNILAS